jgi:hypothetical protein
MGFVMKYTVVAGLLLALVAGVIWFLPQSATAGACEYKIQMQLGRTTVNGHECWMMPGWSAGDQTDFCTNMKTSPAVGKAVASCGAGYVGVCKNAKYPRIEAPDVMRFDSPEFLSNLPPEMHAEYIQKQKDIDAENGDSGGNGFDHLAAAGKRFGGKPLEIYYYPETSGMIKAADLKDMCEQRFGGQFSAVR